MCDNELFIIIKGVSNNLTTNINIDTYIKIDLDINLSHRRLQNLSKFKIVTH